MLPPPLPADSPRPPGLIWHQKLLMNPMDSCGVKSVVSGVMGGGMGLMFGMLFSSTPGDLSHIPVPGPDGKYPPPQAFQWKKHFKEVGRGALWYGKSFGTVGFLFAGSECLIEKARGRTDIWNGLGGGCLSGAALSYKGGAVAMAVGCGGFAAFSLVIDSIMGH